MSLFLPSNASKFITHTLFYFKKDHLRVDWLSIVKTKPMGRVEFVQDENDGLTMRDDVFQLDELVDRYQVALSNDIEENSNFCITDNIFFLF
jgi:hypothetical protein